VKGEEPTPPREGQKAELGIGLDGVMVHVDGEWHEVKVGCCFEFGPGKGGGVEAQEVGYLAWYGEVEEFRRTMWGYAYHRGLGMGGKGGVIGDGVNGKYPGQAFKTIISRSKAPGGAERHPECGSQPLPTLIGVSSILQFIAR